MLQTPGITRAGLFTRRDLLYLGFVSAAGFALGLAGIFHYGYIAQDFVEHRDRILSFPGSFSYAFNDPPGLFWFGSLVLKLVGPAHYLDAIALAFLLINAAGLWIIYGFLWKCVSGLQLRYAAAAFVTFIPFRVIHSIVLAADGFTLPIFALAALLTLRLFENPRSLASWAALSATLSAGMLFKYLFGGLLPPVALLLAVAIWRRLAKGERLHWMLVGVLAVAVPTEVLVYQFGECAKMNGYLSKGQWLTSDQEPVMRWSDMLTLQRSDLDLSSAPDYFTGKFFIPRMYSYPALLHVCVFTDAQGSFQPNRAVSTDWGKRATVYIVRSRSGPSQALQEASVCWCVVFSVLALAGTLYCSALSGLALLTRRPLAADATVVITALAVGFYLPIFLSLHHLRHPYNQGYFLPRLVLPAIVVFYCLGFVLLDSASRHLGRRGLSPGPFLWVFAGYTLVACLIFIGFLA
jgi:4-amino-4-deoxy-L-arabinose transferase-like glycosyltransferase